MFSNGQLDVCREKEAEMMRQHQAGQADLEKHRGLLGDAEKEAAARRAEADDAARRAQGLPEYVPALPLFMPPLAAL